VTIDDNNERIRAGCSEGQSTKVDRDQVMHGEVWSSFDQRQGAERIIDLWKKGGVTGILPLDVETMADLRLVWLQLDVRQNRHRRND